MDMANSFVVVELLQSKLQKQELYSIVDRGMC